MSIVSRCIFHTCERFFKGNITLPNKISFTETNTNIVWILLSYQFLLEQSVQIKRHILDGYCLPTWTRMILSVSYRAISATGEYNSAGTISMYWFQPTGDLDSHLHTIIPSHRPPRTLFACRDCPQPTHRSLHSPFMPLSLRLIMKPWTYWRCLHPPAHRHTPTSRRIYRGRRTRYVVDILLVCFLGCWQLWRRVVARVLSNGCDMSRAVNASPWVTRVLAMPVLMSYSSGDKKRKALALLTSD